MILGIGTDITISSRFERLAQEQSFIKRILTAKERKLFEALDDARKINFLAKRFAGKEAFSKALGCGIGGTIFGGVFSFQSIEIISNPQNAPRIALLEEFLKKEITNPLISFSDEKLENFHLISAFVILEK